MTKNETDTNARTKKTPGEASTAKVQEALAQAAGDVLLRSKLPAAEKAKIASEITNHGAALAELARKAWPAS